MDMAFSFARYMLLDDEKFNAESLKRHAEETIGHLKSNDVSAVAERFGNEVVSVNNPTKAVEKNFKLAVWEAEKLGSVVPADPAMEVEPVIQFMEGRPDGILATVNCPFLYEGKAWLQVELLVVGYNQRKYLIYNGVSTFPAAPTYAPEQELQLR